MNVSYKLRESRRAHPPGAGAGRCAPAL